MQVAAVISQPGKPKGRGNKAVPVPTPVEQLARQHLPDTAILCPKSAKEVSGLLHAVHSDQAAAAACDWSADNFVFHAVHLDQQLQQLPIKLLTGLARDCIAHKVL
jgi:methionyl-tRNA formyltransferase